MDSDLPQPTSSPSPSSSSSRSSLPDHQQQNIRGPNITQPNTQFTKKSVLDAKSLIISTNTYIRSPIDDVKESTESSALTILKSVPSSLQSISPTSAIHETLKPLYIQVPHGRSGRNGSLSLSPSGRDVVIPTRRGIAILDLLNPMAEPILAEFARPPPNYQHQLDPVVKVHWNPYHHHWIASSDRSHVLIWNLSSSHSLLSSSSGLISSATTSPSHSKLDLLSSSGLYSPSLAPNSLHYSNFNSVPSTPAFVVPAPGFKTSVPGTTNDPPRYKPRVQRTLNAHNRIVTDLHWSQNHPDLLATCALDGQIALWDLRKHASLVNVLAQWPLGVHAVRWNTCNPWLLASIHSDSVALWDVRKGSLPVIPKINSSMSKNGFPQRIMSIDWHPQNQFELVSAGMDGHVCVWKINDSNGELITDVELGWPISQVRFSPEAGEALLAIPYNHGIKAVILNSTNWDVSPFILPGLQSIYIAAEWRRGWACSNHSLPTELQSAKEPRSCNLSLNTISSTPMSASKLDSMQIVAWSMLNEICVLPIQSGVSLDTCSTSVIASSELSIVTPTSSFSHKPINSFVIKQTASTPSSGFTPYRNSSARLFQVAPSDILDETKLVPTVIDEGKAVSLSPAPALYTLPQEILWLTTRYPSIKFDVFDIQSRTCVFYLDISNVPFCISIRFPESYPNIVTTLPGTVDPSFGHFDDMQNISYYQIPIVSITAPGLDEELKKAVISQLSAIILRSVTRGLLCIEPCLKYLLGHQASQSAQSSEFSPGLIHPNYGLHGLSSPIPSVMRSKSSAYYPPPFNQDPYSQTAHTGNIMEFVDSEADSTTENIPSEGLTPCVDPIRLSSTYGIDGVLSQSIGHQTPPLVSPPRSMFIDKDHDRRVPFPRLCGVAWSPSGKLALFSISNMMKVTSNESSRNSSGIPRSYDQYQEFRKALDTFSLNQQNKKGRAPLMDTSDNIGSNEEDEDMLISNLYYPKLPSIHATDDILNRMRRKLFPSSTEARNAYLADSSTPLNQSLNSTPSSKKKSGATKSSSANSSILIKRDEGVPTLYRTNSNSNLYSMAGSNNTLLVSELLENKSSRILLLLDMSHLLPFDLELANVYALTPTPKIPNLASLCQHNGKYAMHFGRLDLARLWSMAELVVSDIPQTNHLGFVTNGGLHPLGESMMEYIFAYLEAQKDLQSLAVFASIFAAADNAILAQLGNATSDLQDNRSTAMHSTTQPLLVTNHTMNFTKSPGVMTNDLAILKDHETIQMHRQSPARHSVNPPAMPSPPQLRRGLTIPHSGVTALIPTPLNAQYSPHCSGNGSNSMPNYSYIPNRLRQSLELGQELQIKPESLLPRQTSPTLIPLTNLKKDFNPLKLSVNITPGHPNTSQTSMNKRHPTAPVSVALTLTLTDFGIPQKTIHMDQVLMRLFQYAWYMSGYLDILRRNTLDETRALLTRQLVTLLKVLDQTISTDSMLQAKVRGIWTIVDTYAPSDELVSRCGYESTKNGVMKHLTRCSICRQVLRGLFALCPMCGHGGHPNHLKGWFNLPGVRVCPALGCNCKCLFAIV